MDMIHQLENGAFDFLADNVNALELHEPYIKKQMF